MNKVYETPLNSRYASLEMQEIFSPDRKFKTWRRLWLSLAKAQKQLGLPITDQQIEEMEKNLDNINYDEAKERERQVRHDVMAHIYAFGMQCPSAKPIIHLGATSCYVGDNTDIILMRDAMKVIRRKLINVIYHFSQFAVKYKDLPCLAYTHLQPAQLTTVGKRATLWINELVIDLEDLEYRISKLKLLGSKGTTGTQASFLELFDGSHEKVKKLDELIARDMGFDGVYKVSGQTYSRKVDAQVLSVLSGIAQSCSKFSNDLRILQNFKEIEEPFEAHQIGSSAMPYKRNPMRCERITALARYIIIDSLNPCFTAATQWFERTLDDSSNKRISIPEAFLATDAILNIMLNVCSGLVVYPKVIRQRVMRELPFMATENILMSAVKKGGDRQELHERIRIHSIEAAKRVKEQGEENDLIERICADPAFNITRQEIENILDPVNFIGRSPKQVDEFIEEIVNPILEKNKDILGEQAQLSV